MIWITLSLLAAFFTSLTTILAKIGIKNVNSNFATFIRTGVVILCSLFLSFITKDIYKTNTLNLNNWLFLTLSGLATGCSWLCYYKALKLGNVNKVAPIDKSSFILSSILFISRISDTVIIPIVSSIRVPLGVISINNNFLFSANKFIPITNCRFTKY